jgi:threonine dehydratase
VLRGESVAESTVHAKELAAQRGYAFVHPVRRSDDRRRPGHDRDRDARRPAADRHAGDPVGGGGLCAGMAIWAKHVKPNCRVYGVQTAMCPSMRAAIRGEKPPVLHTHTLADGIAVKTPGVITPRS